MLSVSRGLDRDRVTDETGNQTVVFGRRGARPLSLDEMRPFLRHADGSLYRVEDVSTKDGKPVTKSGRELKPQPPPQAPAPPNPVTATDIGAPPRRPAGPRAEARPAFR